MTEQTAPPPTLSEVARRMGTTSDVALLNPCPVCRAVPREPCRRRSLGPGPYEEYPPMTAGDGDAHFHKERLP